MSNPSLHYPDSKGRRRTRSRHPHHQHQHHHHTSSSSSSSHSSATKTTTLIQSRTHGRERRQQRHITKLDCQRAKQYGMREQQRNGNIKYTYGGIVFIYNPHYQEEVTSFPSHDYASALSGTKSGSVPRLDLARLHPSYTSEQAQLQHHLFRIRVMKSSSKTSDRDKPEAAENKASMRQTSSKHRAAKQEHDSSVHYEWRSHSVLMVDMSGSMRRDDIDGAKCRSDAIWMALASNFLKPQLEYIDRDKERRRKVNDKDSSAKNENEVQSVDLISVVVMRNDTAEVYMKCEPLTWVLYNKFVQLREWDTMRPTGRGNFGPALTLATQLLAMSSGNTMDNDDFSALSLVICSDGHPSDFCNRLGWNQQIKALAQTYRRRLTVCCLAMVGGGNADDKSYTEGTSATGTINQVTSHDDFAILQELLSTAEQYGSTTVASYHRGGVKGLDVEQFCTAFSTFGTSLTAARTELVDGLSHSSYVTREGDGTYDHGMKARSIPRLFSNGRLTHHQHHRRRRRLKQNISVEPRESRTGEDIESSRDSFPPVSMTESDLLKEWKVYTGRRLRRLWKWSLERNDCCYLPDFRRCTVCLEDVVVEDHFSIGCGRRLGRRCPQCRSCAICFDCLGSSAVLHPIGSACQAFVRDVANGTLLSLETDSNSIPSFSIAMKASIFDEGAERMVHHLRFLRPSMNNEQTPSWTFVGQSMVAKESRFLVMDDEATKPSLPSDIAASVDATTGVPVRESCNYHDRIRYHHDFLRAQSLASFFATQFNQALDNLMDHFDEQYHDWIRALPRVYFLNPYVVEVLDNDGGDDPQELVTKHLLIEPLLKGRYQKWNNNLGYVKPGTAPTKKTSSSNGSVHVHDIERNFLNDDDDEYDDVDSDARTDQLGLDAIVEEEGDDCESDIAEPSKVDLKTKGATSIPFSHQAWEAEPGSSCYSDVQDSYFPQAFSHFTYEHSSGKCIVVDLQGVFQDDTSDDDNKHGDCNNPSRTRSYQLTDPVIHSRSRSRKRSEKGDSPSYLWSFGRTDRGVRGMKAFFETHVCTDVCKLLGLKEHTNGLG